MILAPPSGRRPGADAPPSLRHWCAVPALLTLSEHTEYMVPPPPPPHKY